MDKKTSIENIQSFLVRNGMKPFENSHTFTKDKILFYFNRVELLDKSFCHVIVKAWETGEVIIYKEDFKNF